jgi:hypothetical protein
VHGSLKDLWAFDCMSSVPSPAGYSTTRADKEFEGLSTDIEHQHNDHPRRLGTMYKPIYYPDPICSTIYMRNLLLYEARTTAVLL